MSQGITLADFLNTVKGLDNFVDSLPKDVVMQLCDQSLENVFTDKIIEMEMPSNLDFITFGSDYSVITKHEIERFIQNNTSSQMRLKTVRVSYIPIDWLYHDNGLNQFLVTVRTHKHKLFDTLLIHSLFESLWRDF